MRSALKLARMRNVPADSEIHVKGRRIRRVLIAIDVGTSELLLSREFGCDAVIAHHPAGGRAQLEGYKVFHRHVDQLIEAGIPKQAAETAIATKFHQLEVQHHSRNYDQVTSAARRLRIPLMSIHSPCDEIGRKIMIQAVKGLDSSVKVSDMVSGLNRLPEYRNAETKIEVRLGSTKNRLGKVAISHAAYTNGGFNVAKTYFEHGVETLSYIHISDVDLERLVDEKRGNLVVTGHIASDWLGINRLIVELEKNSVEVISTTDLQART